ncbi:MAG TPA: hypothetical protein VGJ77_09820 [Gaiellaceae bacterium]
MSAPPVLTDGSIELRAQRESDVEAHVRAFAEDAELARWLGYEQDEQPDGVRRRIERPYAVPARAAPSSSSRSPTRATTRSSAR